MTTLQIAVTLTLVTDRTVSEMPSAMPPPSQTHGRGAPLSSRTPDRVRSHTALIWEIGLSADDEPQRHLLALCHLHQAHRAFFDDCVSRGDEMYFLAGPFSHTEEVEIALPAERLAAVEATGIELILEFRSP
jgi:hypothetical protein